MSRLGDLLSEARTVIADRARWTTDYLARNEHDTDVRPDDPAAVCFCALGCLAHVRQKPGIIVGDPLLAKAADRLDDAAIALLASPRLRSVDGGWAPV